MNPSEAAIRPILGIEESRKTPKKSSSVILTLILLGIIGYSGYRVWPPVLDIWQRMHQPAEAPEIPVKSPPVIPVTNSVSPDTNSDGSSPAAPPDQKMTPVAAGENPALTQPVVPVG